MLGTSRVCDPSVLVTSTARPRLTWSWRMTPGLPSTRVKAEFMTGMRPNAFTTAQPAAAPAVRRVPPPPFRRCPPGRRGGGACSRRRSPASSRPPRRGPPATGGRSPPPVRRWGRTPRPASRRGSRRLRTCSAPQQLGHPEGEVERLAGVQAGVAHGLVAVLEVVGEHLVGPAEALGHVLPGELHVDAAGPRSLGPVDGEVAPDLLHDVLEVPGLVAVGTGVGVAVHG